MPIELPSTPTNLGTLPNQINSFSGVSVLAEVAGGGGGGGGGPVDGLHTEAAEQLITEAGDFLIWEEVLLTSNYSLDFDGVDDYVSLGTSMKSILDGATNFSFETWIKSDSGTAAGGMIFQQENTDVGDFAHTRVSFVESSGYKLENIIRTASGTSNLRTGTLSLGTWYHFVGTFDGAASGGTHKIYLNGTLVGTATGKGSAFATSSANANARFGTTYKTTRPFDGHIADFRMWDSTLDADAITSLYNSGNPIDPRENFGNYDSWTGNLVGFWPMETDSGDTVVDLGSGGNDGTKGATGFPAWSTDSI